MDTYTSEENTYNKATAAVVISRLRISNNGEPKEIKGLCSKITPLDIEEGSRVKVSNWKIVSGLDLVQVIFTFGTPSSNDKGDIRPF